MKIIFDTPWKAINEIRRLLIYPKVRLLFAINRIKWEKNWRFYGVPVIQKHRKSLMQFGKGLQLRSSTKSNPLGVYHPVILSTREKSACLKIGTNFGMSGGAICACKQIIIGQSVTVGANTIITDSDFHPLDFENRKDIKTGGRSDAILIEDGVFIGMNCLILKGVNIGKRSVIGAGSVVTRDVPPNVIYAGNPARHVSNVSNL